MDAEQAVLGALLLDATAWPRVRQVLAEGDFYRAGHRAIWRAIESVHHEDGTPDVLTVAEVLLAEDELDRCGGLAYLQGLPSSTPSAANVAAYVEIVKRKARLRELAAVGEKLRQAAMAPSADADEIEAEAENTIEVIKYGNGERLRGWPSPLDLAALATLEPASPEEICVGLPVGYATGTWGHGGIGKSQIELMRAICIASGTPFCGLEVKRRRVLYLSCEDREQVLHWRLARVCRHLGIDLASLAGWLCVLDLVGRDSILYAPNPRTGNPFTFAFDALKRHVRNSGTEVLFVDGVTDTFGGNENARAEVKQYVNALVGLIPAERGAVVLIGHVNKSFANGIGSEAYSGSTAWHSSVRARWTLTPETKAGGDGERAARTGKVILELVKANHAELGTRIEFAWDADANLFVGSTAGTAPVVGAQDRDHSEQASIVWALRACAEKGIVVPAATTGRRTGFHVLEACADFPESIRSAGKAGTRRFWRHIEVLRQDGRIANGKYIGVDRHAIATLVLAGNAGNTE